MRSWREKDGWIKYFMCIYFVILRKISPHIYFGLPYLNSVHFFFGAKITRDADPFCFGAKKCGIIYSLLAQTSFFCRYINEKSRIYLTFDHRWAIQSLAIRKDGFYSGADHRAAASPAPPAAAVVSLPFRPCASWRSSPPLPCTSSRRHLLQARILEPLPHRPFLRRPSSPPLGTSTGPRRSASLLVLQWPPHRCPLVPPVGQSALVFISLILFLRIDMIQNPAPEDLMPLCSLEISCTDLILCKQLNV